VSTRSGAGRIVVGAGAAGISHLSVFAPSQSLPLMLPAIKQLRKAGVPAVLHVLAQAMRDDLSYASDVSGVLLTRDAGAAVIASYTVQVGSPLCCVALSVIFCIFERRECLCVPSS
jgi:pyruvate/2-oxoacid:ferredoxin oxidoreductase alpha subunit